MEILIFWLICAFVTAIIASSKGRSGVGWFFVGLLISVFGIILIACLPSVQTQDSKPVSNGPAEKKQCPDCAETVLRGARVCKHCGYRFDAA